MTNNDSSNMVVAVLSMQSTKKFASELSTIGDALTGLTFTAGGATGPEVEALRDQAVELVEGFSSLLETAQTARLVQMASGGTNNALLAVMLSK